MATSFFRRDIKIRKSSFAFAGYFSRRLGRARLFFNILHLHSSQTSDGDARERAETFPI